MKRRGAKYCEERKIINTPVNVSANRSSRPLPSGRKDTVKGQVGVKELEFMQRLCSWRFVKLYSWCWIAKIVPAHGHSYAGSQPCPATQLPSRQLQCSTSLAHVGRERERFSKFRQSTMRRERMM